MPRADRAVAIGVKRLARAVPGQPASIVGLLIVVQWVAVVAFALTVRHNGWLYYQGGDESAYYTTAWALGNGQLPVTAVGWGWSTLLSPIAAIAGKSFLGALPAIIVLQVLVLLPLAIVSLYAIGARLGGRIVGYLAAGTWIAAPFLGILVADPRYHERWVEQFLPQLLGLTGLADFPSLVAILAAAALILRALAGRSRPNVLLAGLVTSFAIGIKPANALFLFGAALAFLLARRFADGIVFALALVPGLIVLLLWKQRGLGQLPLLALSPHVLAAATGLSLPAPPSVLGMITGSSYVHLNWGRIDQNLIALREFFWNTRLYEVLPFIGLAAVLRRSLAATGLIVGWFAAYFVVKGANEFATVDSGSFFRLLMPALPAYVLLLAAIPLLIPVVGARLMRAGRELPVLELRAPRRLVGAVALVLVAAPLVLIGVAPHLPAGSAVKYFQNGTYVPVGQPHLIATVVGDGKAAVQLSWSAPATAGVSVYYKVFRGQRDPVTCLPVSGGTSDCQFDQYIDGLSIIRGRSLTDTPGTGTWWYAVGVVANWVDDSTKGDVLMLSNAVPVQIH